MAWPRVSHLAIAALAAGLTVLHYVDGRFAKSAVLLLTAFLTTFIRPEFVLAFDIAIVCCVVFGVIEFAYRAPNATTPPSAEILAS